MKCLIKEIQTSGNGVNPLKEFNTLKELRKYLNEVFYYSEDIHLFIESVNSVVFYSEVDTKNVPSLGELVREAKFYNEPLIIAPTWEIEKKD